MQLFLNIQNMTKPIHKNELPIDHALVRRLIDNQFPQYSTLPLSQLGASGSTNILFRLGDEYLVRLPRQPESGASVKKEQRWLAMFKDRLPVEIPTILALGEPDLGYSETWAISSWLEGSLPLVCNPDDPIKTERVNIAHDLANVLLTFRSIEVPAAAVNAPELRLYRGGALKHLDQPMRQNIETCRSFDELEIDLDAVLDIWNRAMKLPGVATVNSTNWYHGDLVAENLLLRRGGLVGVLDFGGLGVGDPTIDLHGAWELLDAPALEVFRERVNVDDAEWLRGRAWALTVGMMTFEYYRHTMPGRVRDRLAMVRSVIADATRLRR
jgi:aminoglycoside phosphotransferase (APT) family kinase protein